MWERSPRLDREGPRLRLVDNRDLISWTLVFLLGGTVLSVAALFLWSLADDAIVIPVIAAILGVVWTAMFETYRGERDNRDLLERLGNPPPAVQPVPPSPPPAQASGSGRFSVTASVIAMPPRETILDHLRAERFLSEAPFPNDSSRRNAQTWLSFLRVQQPYLSAKLPPVSAALLSDLRLEVASESMRKLRNEVSEFFRRNSMAWPEVRNTHEPPATKTEPTAGPRRGELGEQMPRISSRGQSSAVPPSYPSAEDVLRGLRERDRVARRFACNPGPYEIEVGEFAEVPLATRKGERLLGRLIEIDGQDFDWAIVDQSNSILVHEREEYDYVKGEDHVSASEVNWKVPKDGPWYLVLEIPYRQNQRSVRVELRREPG